MPRDDGVRTGGGGKVMVQEIVEVPSEAPKTFAEKQKKVEVLEERLMDALPSDTEPEVDDDEDV